MFSVTAWGIGEWIVAVAAVVTSVGIIWRKAIKPFANWCKEVADLTRRIVSVVERVEGEWSPAMELLKANSSKLSDLHEKVGNLDDRTRRLEGDAIH